MSLFGGCGNNNDSWIWILIIVFLIFCCGNDRECGLLGGSSNNGCGC